MKKSLMIIPLVILLCFTFGCQKGEEVAEEATLDEAKKSEIAETIKELTAEVFNAGIRDLDETFSYFSDNTIAIEHGKIDYSWEEHKKNAKVMMANIVDYKLTMGEVEVDVLSADVAILYGFYSYMMKDKSDNIFEGTNAWTWVFVNEEGSWKIRHVHLSTPMQIN